jgi:glycosyltransferase involved in cell wall biosynthesis
MPRVSIIIPAYNAEPFIDASVQSALAQTCRDREVIVVDDSSTDRTPALLQAYGDRIRVLRKRNGGAAAARNAGANAATGEWLAFLDADDLWEPAKLDRQLALSTASPWSYTNRINIGTRGDVPELQSEVTVMHAGDVFVPLLLEGNFMTSSSVMIRRDVFQELGGFLTTEKNAEDWDLWLRVAARHPVAYCAEPLVRYRFHAGGKSRNHRRMAAARRSIVARALASPRGRRLGWLTRRRVWSETWRTNAWDAGQAGARGAALTHYARAAAAWPFHSEPLKGAVRVCLNV